MDDVRIREIVARECGHEFKNARICRKPLTAIDQAWRGSCRVVVQFFRQIEDVVITAIRFVDDITQCFPKVVIFVVGLYLAPCKDSVEEYVARLLPSPTQIIDAVNEHYPDTSDEPIVIAATTNSTSGYHLDI